MKKFKILLALPIVVGLALGSCKKDEPTEPYVNNGTNAEQVGTLNLGANVVADFFGEVTNESGSPVSGATVTVGNKTTTTDANGIFFVSDATVKEDLAYIKCEKAGYFLGSRSLIPNTASTNSIKIEMMALDIAETVVSGQVATVTVDGASIILQGDYVDASGSPYNGLVNVAMKYMDPSAPSTQNRMPGMLYAEDESGNAGALETYGMIAVELLDQNGGALQIANGSDAIIQMPVDPGQLAEAPSTIPLWHFDEVAGYWVEDGFATLDGDKYVGTVSHFSFWNCDAFWQDCQFCGTIVDQFGNPIPNAVVNIYTTNAQTSGTAGADGSFCTYLPANEDVTFEIFDMCGSQIAYVDLPACTNGTQNSETIVAQTSTQSLHVTGLATDCQANTITNGQIEIIMNGNSFFFPIDNGIVDVVIPSCTLPANVDINIVDYATLQEDTQTNVPVVGGLVDLGLVQACTAIQEYINFEIDGNLVTAVTAITCEEQPDSLGSGTILVISWQQSPDYIYLYSSATTAGNYDLVQDVYNSTGMNFWSSNAQPPLDFIIAPTVVCTQGAYPSVGGWLDITMTGTYYDQSSQPHTIDVDLHVQRDS